MAGSRYVLGWGAVLALSVGASAGTLVLVRQAIGDGNLADPLSQSQVQTQYADALHPAPSATRRAAGSGTSSAVNAPTSTPSTQHPSGSSTSTSSGQQGGTGGSTHSHASGSGSSSTSHTTPAPPPASITRVLTSSGGSVVARCTDNPGGPARIYLVSWSPAQGYAVNGVQRGPSEEAEIEFESDASSVSVQFHCTTSGPVQQVDSGGGWGGDGGDGGPGGGGGDG